MINNSVQNFLDIIIELARSNPSLKITNRFLYAQLISFNLGIGVIPFENTEKYFRDWITKFQNHPTIDVYRDKKNPYICHFLSRREEKTPLKLYIPLKSTYIKDCVLELFDFLTRKNIIHDSKVLSSVRNDNVIVKVTCIEDANKIIKYVKNNMLLSNNLLNANPLLFPCSMIGATVDNNYTYLVEVCEVIADVIEELRSRNELEKCTIKFIRNTFSKLAVKCNDDELSEIYRFAALVLDEESTIQDFANYVLESADISYVGKHKAKITQENSVSYLDMAITETFKRYNNLSFVINAVRLYITAGDSRGFTRINHARQNVDLYCDKEQLKTLFDKEQLDFSIKYYILKVITTDN